MFGYSQRFDWQTELFRSDFMAYRNQDFRFGSSYPEVHEIFSTSLWLQACYIYCQFLSALWFDVQESLTLAYHLAIRLYSIVDLVLLQSCEVETVLDSKLTSSQVYSFEAYVLVSVLHFSHSRVRSTVRSHDTVTQEVTVTWCIYTEVTTVCPVVASVFIHLVKTLVYPVPNVTTLEVRILVDSIPLSSQVTIGVTHSVRIFRRNDWTVATLAAYTFQPLGIWILRNIHIRIPFPKSTFVVYRTVHTHWAGFLFLQIKVCLVEVVTVTGFVTE